MNTLCTYPNCWMKAVRSCYPRFHKSASADSWSTWKSQIIDANGIQTKNFSTLVPKKEKTCEVASYITVHFNFHIILCAVQLSILHKHMHIAFACFLLGLFVTAHISWLPIIAYLMFPLKIVYITRVLGVTSLDLVTWKPEHLLLDLVTLSHQTEEWPS